MITTPPPRVVTRTEPEPVAVLAFARAAVDVAAALANVRLEPDVMGVVPTTAVVGVTPSVADDAVGAVSPAVSVVGVGTPMLEMVGLMVPALARPGVTPVAVSAGAGALETTVGAGIDAELAVTAGAPPTPTGAVTDAVGLTTPPEAATAGAGAPATVAKLVKPAPAADAAEATAFPATPALPASPAMKTGAADDAALILGAFAFGPMVAPAEFPDGDAPAGEAGPNTRP
ncbi:MAG TPA: hypothetical protein VFL80_01850 [Thermoanaerobaculia bacterium]|nr:hypothetical protein [Thermoanaerobaculia bacterium]